MVETTLPAVVNSAKEYLRKGLQEPAGEDVSLSSFAMDEPYLAALSLPTKSEPGGHEDIRCL